MTVMPYAEIDVHGTPSGYKAGCKTDAMCDPSAPWSCKRAYERSRGDYQFRMRIEQGLTPHEIRELELADEARIREEEAAWLQREGMKGTKPPKKPKDGKKTRRFGNDLDSLHRYGTSVPTPMTPPAAAALAASHEKETPMNEITLPEGVSWKEPPASALLTTRSGKNARIIAAAKAKPGEWLCLGQAATSAATRWRKGEVTGTKPGEFQAVVDTGLGNGTKGDLYVRYVAPKQQSAVRS